MDTFNASYLKGRAYEEILVKAFPDRLELMDGKTADIKHKPSGKMLEVKTEMRSLDDTPNYFVERFSNSGRVDGGAWQALGKSVELFGFYFPKSKRFHLFLTSEFVRRAEQYLAERKPRMIEIPTAGTWETYTTIGCPIPRSYFADLLVADVEVDPWESFEEVLHATAV
jgi:hypothetical protein